MFADEGQADRAWQAGVLGFAPPAPGEMPAGRDSRHGHRVGRSRLDLPRPARSLASWRKSVFVALVVVTNLDDSAFKAATAAVDARLN